MTAPRIAVLGGSSPSTLALVDALAEQGAAPGLLSLCGREPTALGLVARYATSRLRPLGWQVSAADDLAAALDCARVVVHQVRYGGLDGRAADEALAGELEVPADETLGPAGLQAALRTALMLGPVAAAIRAHGDDPLVVNLTNPLGASTAALRHAGLPAVVGLCELPLTTVQAAAAVLGMPPDALDWTYAGLNHRGFVLRLAYDGEDLLAHLPARLGDGRTVAGIRGAEIAGLGALPTKYHALLRAQPPPTPPRAALLDRLRTTVLAELRGAPTVAPRALQRRPAEWHPLAVVPFLRALDAATPSRHVVNLPCPDGLVRELPAQVSRAGIVPDPAPAGNTGAPVRAWQERFDRHERAVLRALADPSPPTIRAALAADPITPEAVVDAAASRIGAHLAALPG
jgi:6-phospho-beta-glucosidase